MNADQTDAARKGTDLPVCCTCHQWLAGRRSICAARPSARSIAASRSFSTRTSSSLNVSSCACKTKQQPTAVTAALHVHETRATCGPLKQAAASTAHPDSETPTWCGAFNRRGWFILGAECRHSAGGRRATVHGLSSAALEPTPTAHRKTQVLRLTRSLEYCT